MPLLIIAAAISAQTAGATTSPALVEQPKALTSIGKSTFVDLEGGVGYATNPQLRLGKDNSSAFVRLSARLVHTLLTDRTSTVLTAYGQSFVGSKKSGSSKSFQVSASHSAAITEKLRVFGSADASYDKGGQLDTRVLSVPNVPVLPGLGFPTSLTTRDNLLRFAGRTDAVSANVGASWKMAPRDSLSASSGFSHTVLKTGALKTRTNSTTASIGYERQVSERSTVGARVATQFTHYSGGLQTGAGDVRVITPQLTTRLQLSSTLSFSADAGTSLSRIDNGAFSRRSVGLAGDANLCSALERSNFCFRASLQQQAATTAGSARIVSFGADYSRRLSVDDTVQVSVNAQRYSNPVIIPQLPLSEGTYLRAAADYSRHLGGRLFAGANVAVRKVTQTGPDPQTDFSAAIFLKYRFGSLQ